MQVDIVTILRHLPGALVLFAASTTISQAQERDRSKVPDEYKWDLSALYPSDAGVAHGERKAGVCVAHTSPVSGHAGFLGSAPGGLLWTSKTISSASSRACTAMRP